VILKKKSINEIIKANKLLMRVLRMKLRIGREEGCYFLIIYSSVSSGMGSRCFDYPI